MTQPPNSEPAHPTEEDEDFYFDGPYLVFTEAYHRKRGYCCQSGCRHCPYSFDQPQAETAAPPEQKRQSCEDGSEIQDE